VNENALASGAERAVAWLRIAAFALIVAAETIPHPNPNHTTFRIAAAVALIYAAGALVWAYKGTITRPETLALTAADVVSITVLAYLSGGPYSEARLAYFLIPFSVAFRFGWKITVAVSATVLLGYGIQAATHPAHHLAHGAKFVYVELGYLAWIGAAAALFSALLERRQRELERVSRGRRRLLAEVMRSEDDQRRLLAEGLHDHAIQNVLAARQDVDEAQALLPREELVHAHAALTDTLADLRGAIVELHPHILAEAGLETALRAAAERASRRGGFGLELELSYPHRHPDEAVLFNAAREFLANAAKHARATEVAVHLAQDDGYVVLTTRDNGVGFDMSGIDAYVTDAHIGLLSQRERLEAIGGRLEIRSAPGAGTTVVATLPAAGGGSNHAVIPLWQ
jgi:two-component system NarL family sensor kinase